MIVVDSSFLIASLLAEHRSAFVDEVLDASLGEQHGPQLLSFEVLNVLSRKGRRGEITVSERDRAVQAYAGLDIQIDLRPDLAVLERALSLAETWSLSGYDAAYLELSLRLGAELATLDSDLAKAGRGCGLRVHHA